MEKRTSRSSGPKANTKDLSVAASAPCHFQVTPASRETAAPRTPTGLPFVKWNVSRRPWAPRTLKHQ